MFFIYILVAPGEYLFLEHYEGYRCWTTNFDSCHLFDDRAEAQKVIDNYLDYDVDVKIGKVGENG